MIHSHFKEDDSYWDGIRDCIMDLEWKEFYAAASCLREIYDMVGEPLERGINQ
jgi:hypothetical protein